MARQIARGLVPIYSVPRAEVAGRVMLYNPNGGGVSIRNATTFEEIARRPLSDQDSPRLHPDGSLYYCRADILYRCPADGGLQEEVRRFGDTVSIGGGEGDFSPTFRYLPIRRGRHAGLFNVETGQYMESPVDGAIDFVHTSKGGRVLCVGLPGVGIFAAARRNGRLGPWRAIAPEVGHSAPAEINRRPFLVTTTSAWKRDIPRGGGSQEWLVAVPLEGGPAIPITMLNGPGKWLYSIHVSCWRDWACVSFYGEPESAPIWLVRLRQDAKPRTVATTAGGDGSYWSQPHSAWSHDGKRIYFADNGTCTYTVDVSPITKRRRKRSAKRKK